MEENVDYNFDETIKSPKVSVIIPVYNSERFIEKCLTSVMKQTLRELEIIVVNDGSTDLTLTILNRLAAEDSRIKIINQENKKQGAARNAGTKIARGEYIGFIDSDDWIDVDYFEKLYDTAKKYNADISLATNIRIGNGKTKKRLEISEEKYVTALQEKFNICNLPKNPCPTNKIYRREFLNSFNIVWPEGIYCEDKIFVTKSVYYANGVVTVPNVNYYYYRNPNSTVNSKIRKHKEKFIIDKNNAKLSVIEFLREKNVTFVDKKLWVTTKEIPKQLPVISIKESVLTKRIYLFSFLCIGEMSL